jgi:hypothetical protein
MINISSARIPTVHGAHNSQFSIIEWQVRRYFSTMKKRGGVVAIVSICCT